MEELREELIVLKNEAEEAHRKEIEEGKRVKNSADRHLIELDAGSLELIPDEYLELWGEIRHYTDMDQGAYDRYAEKVHEMVIREGGEDEKVGKALTGIRALIVQELYKKYLEFQEKKKAA